jgi:exodeoxyribonuclease VIII
MAYKRIDGLPEAEYHAIKALGSSAIKSMAVSPAYFQQKQAEVSEVKEALLIGSMFHQLVLEPDRDEFIAAPDVDRRTKEGKAAYAEFLENCEGKSVLKKADFENVVSMVGKSEKTPKGILYSL